MCLMMELGIIFVIFCQILNIVHFKLFHLLLLFRVQGACMASRTYDVCMSSGRQMLVRADEHGCPLSMLVMVPAVSNPDQIPVACTDPMFACPRGLIVGSCHSDVAS